MLLSDGIAPSLSPTSKNLGNERKRRRSDRDLGWWRGPLELRFDASAPDAGALHKVTVIGLHTPTGDENANAGDDYDITKTNGAVLLVGNGAANTMIDGNSLDRVFDIRPRATALFRELTITGGTTVDTDHGSGFRALGSTVVLSGVEITGNRAAKPQ